MTQREGTEPRGPVKILTRSVSSQRSDSCKFGGSQSPLATVPRAPRPGPARRRVCTFRGPRVGGVRGVAADAAVQRAAEAPALEHGEREPPQAGVVVELPALRHDAALHVARALLAHEARVDPYAGAGPGLRLQCGSAGRPTTGTWAAKGHLEDGGHSGWPEVGGKDPKERLPAQGTPPLTTTDRCPGSECVPLDALTWGETPTEALLQGVRRPPGLANGQEAGTPRPPVSPGLHRGSPRSREAAAARGQARSCSFSGSGAD